MNADSGVALTALKVDGGMVFNDTLMQFQADVLGVPVIRPKVAETTALGAAYAAGLAVGFWAEIEDLRANWAKDARVAAEDGRRPPRQGVRALEEGRHADLRLGRLTSARASDNRPRRPSGAGASTSLRGATPWHPTRPRTSASSSSRTAA